MVRERKGLMRWLELGYERGRTIERGGEVDGTGKGERGGVHMAEKQRQRGRGRWSGEQERTGWDGKQQKFASQSRIEIITRETRARKGWRNTDTDANADGQMEG